MGAVASPLPVDRTATLSPSSSSEEPEPEPEQPALAPELVDDPDRYRQLAEHARGGLGRVIRAFDTRLGRTVAVKELLRGGSSNENRFLREALITARLEHPGIVPVHEAGRWPNGDPYYVMKLVSGRTLKELIAEQPTPRRRLALLPHVIAVADAVGYAHSEGVIHRDVKPANIVVGAFGDTVVVDWGLARDCRGDVPDPEPDDDHVLDERLPRRPASAPLAHGSRPPSTVSGKVVGTPSYMSPEQARGEVVDECADVYAIGAVLYELLAGVPPYTGDTAQAVVDAVLAGPPRPLLELVPGTPVDLATIVAKAMARDPASRYRNATALAEDLRRYQTGQLVWAHAYTPWSLIRRKLARHRAAVAVACAGAVALAVIGGASVRRVVAERNIARSERGRAERALSSTEQRQRQLVLLQAVTSLRKDPTAALAWLKLYPIGPAIGPALGQDGRGHDGEAARSEVVDVIDEAVALGVARHVFRTGDWVFDAMFTPDGQTVLAAVRDGIIRSYDLRTGALRELGKAPSTPEVLALAPTGDQLVTGGWGGEVMVWPLSGDPAPRVIATGGARVTEIRFGAPGHIVVDRDSGRPEDIELATGTRTALGPATALHLRVATRDWSHMVALTTPNQLTTPDGRALAHTDREIGYFELSPLGDLVLLHDGATLCSVPYAGGPLRPLFKYDGRIKGATFSPDQRSVAIFGTRSEIELVDLATGTTRELRGHSDAIYSVAFSHDGKLILSAGDDSTARVWNLAEDSSLELRGHDDDVYRARFSPDERSVATASLDGSVRVWPLDQPGERVLTEGRSVEGLTLSGDRAFVKTAGAFAVWDLATGRRDELFSWAQEPHGLGVGVASPDGSQLVLPGADSSMEVRRRGAPPVVLRGHKSRITQIEWSHDNAMLYSSSVDGTLRRWNPATGAATTLIDGNEPVRGFAVAADGRVVTSVGNTALLIKPDGTVTTLGTGDRFCANHAEFDKVRDRLVIQRCDQSFAIIDGNRTIELPTAGYAISRIAVSPDGSLLAAGMSDRTVRVWDTATGRLDVVLHGHSDLVLDVAFSPDGRELASSAYDKTVWIWQLADDRHRVLRGHSSAVARVLWRGAGELISASTDGTVRVWDVPPSRLPLPDEITSRLRAATSAEIDRGDRPTTTPANETPTSHDLGAMLDHTLLGSGAS